ncbi:hypothetical protein [Streptomyces violascens]|uniref:hypothetical protein n=1 Tax=Streptomyces violascens TaxID=67381 RepID=UPI0036657ACD
MFSQETPPGQIETAATAKPHNAGSRDDRRTAIKAMASYAQSITIVAVTAIAFTVGLINGIPHPCQVWALKLGWVMLLVSVAFAYFAVGQYASQMARSIIKARQGPLEVLLLIGFLALMAGLSFVTVFGFNNVSGN